MNRVRKRLTYANVMSTVAVFLAMGGAAAVATNHVLPRNSVGTPQLKKNAVKTGKVARNAIRVGKLAPEAVKAGKLAKNAVPTDRLRDNAVTGSKIAGDAVTSEKLAPNAVTTGKVDNGAITGEKLSAITVRTASVNVAAGANGSANVVCPDGLRALSGGGAWGAFNKEFSFLSTRPIRSALDVGQMADGEVAQGWRASGTNGSAEATTIHVWVLCLE